MSLTCKFDGPNLHRGSAVWLMAAEGVDWENDYRRKLHAATTTMNLKESSVWYGVCLPESCKGMPCVEDGSATTVYRMMRWWRSDDEVDSRQANHNLEERHSGCRFWPKTPKRY